MPTRRYLVSGRVQGVSFRAATRHRARELGVDGHAHNLADGRVKSNVEGYTKEIGTVVYVGDTESLLTASGDKAVKVANAPLPEAGDSFLHTADASLDGTRIIAGGQDSILRVWDGTAKKLIASFPSPEADAGKVAGK